MFAGSQTGLDRTKVAESFEKMESGLSNVAIIGFNDSDTSHDGRCLSGRGTGGLYSSAVAKWSDVDL